MEGEGGREELYSLASDWLEVRRERGANECRSWIGVVQRRRSGLPRGVMIRVQGRVPATRCRLGVQRRSTGH